MSYYQVIVNKGEIPENFIIEFEKNNKNIAKDVFDLLNFFIFIYYPEDLNVSIEVMGNDKFTFVINNKSPQIYVFVSTLSNKDRMLIMDTIRCYYKSGNISSVLKKDKLKL